MPNNTYQPLKVFVFFFTIPMTSLMSICLMSNSIIPQIFLTSVENLSAYSDLFSNADRRNRLDKLSDAVFLLCAAFSPTPRENKC